MRITAKMAAIVALAVAVPALAQADEPKQDQFQRTLAGALKAVGGNTDNTAMALGDYSKDLLANWVEDGVKKAAYRWDPNLEISIEGMEDNRPTFGLLTVQPFYESSDYKHTGFAQASVFRSDGRTTGNIGLGYRRMSGDEKWLYGANTFYDHEWPYDHKRWSIGMDIRSSALEFSANRYMAISGSVDGASGEEQALDGYDIEIGTQIPYLPSVKVYAKKFFWDAVDGVDDLEGYQYSFAVDAPILPGMTLEAGLRDYDGSESSSRFVKLSYKIAMWGGDDAAPVPNFISNKAFELTSMKDRRLDKVRRQNKIVKQLAFNATVSGF